MNQMYGFDGEVKSKYSAQMAELFTEVYNWLPLAHCLNNKVLVSKINERKERKINKCFFMQWNLDQWQVLLIEFLLYQKKQILNLFFQCIKNRIHNSIN